MAVLDCKKLKSSAQNRLGQVTGDPRVLVLLNTGVIVLLNLLVSGLNMFLDHQIGSTSGLSGLGTRSILETIQSLLSYFTILFTPFWSAGFLACVIQMVRQQKADPKTMAAGFHRFPSIILLNLNKLFLTILVITSITYLSSTIFLLTPFSGELSKVTESLLESGSLLLADGTINLQAIPADVLLHACIPLFIIFFALFLPVYAFISYSLRLSTYLVMEGRRISGFAAIMMSFQLMRGHRFQMFKLDLSFWWYYVVDALLTVVLYLDVILPLMGIPLPFNSNVAYFLFLILYSMLQTAFYLWKKLPVDMTYVVSYDAIAHEDQDTPSL